MHWRILDSDPPGPGLSGALHMALDEAILADVEAGRSPPTLRIYGWDPPCLSLGHSQLPRQELDLPRAKAMGFDVVMRPTGGRVVLHIDELTYSVIAPSHAEPWCATQSASYRVISQAVAEALAGEGFGVTLDRGYPVEKSQDLRAMTPCFSSTARSEVVWEDRKVVGSAQRRLRAAFLQHGSILLSPRHRQVVETLRLDPDRRRQYLDVLDRNAVSLEEVLGRPVPWRDLAQGFPTRFAAALGIEGAPGGLTEREVSTARDLESAHRIFQAQLWDGDGADRTPGLAVSGKDAHA